MEADFFCGSFLNGLIKRNDFKSLKICSKLNVLEVFNRKSGFLYIEHLNFISVSELEFERPTGWAERAERRQGLPGSCSGLGPGPHAARLDPGASLSWQDRAAPGAAMPSRALSHGSGAAGGCGVGQKRTGTHVRALFSVLSVPRAWACAASSPPMTSL